MRTSSNYERAGIPEDERIGDLKDSPVTEQEMKAAVEALKEETIPKVSDADRISILRKELENIPPRDGDKGKKAAGREGVEGKELLGMHVEYKKCEACQGSGRKYLFFGCKKCKGTGSIAQNMEHSVPLSRFFDKAKESVIRGEVG